LEKANFHHIYFCWFLILMEICKETSQSLLIILVFACEVKDVVNMDERFKGSKATPELKMLGNYKIRRGCEDAGRLLPLVILTVITATMALSRGPSDPAAPTIILTVVFNNRVICIICISVHRSSLFGISDRVKFFKPLKISQDFQSIC